MTTEFENDVKSMFMELSNHQNRNRIATEVVEARIFEVALKNYGTIQQFRLEAQKLPLGERTEKAKTVLDILYTETDEDTTQEEFDLLIRKTIDANYNEICKIVCRNFQGLFNTRHTIANYDRIGKFIIRKY